MNHTTRVATVLALAMTGLAFGTETIGAQTPSPREVDAVFAEFARAGSVGCALGVARDGELVYQKGYGYANLDWDIPITPRTVFYVGSISKQFTAAAIVLLAHDAKLDLDDDVRRFLPEMPERDPEVVSSFFTVKIFSLHGPP